MAEATVTAAFIDEILALNYETIPPEAIEMAKQVTLDVLGVICAGYTEPLGVGRISVEYVRQMGEAPQATVIAGGFKSSMPSAAYANGTLAHALDFDNTWYPLNHPTSPTLPAILAVAEHYRLSGREIIEAIVCAFETQGRVRLATPGTTREPGTSWHKPGTTGIFGAVAGAAKLLKLDREQTLMAFGLTGSRAGNMTINTGTMTKSSHSGHAARMGVECALLAKMGWTASPDVFGPKGFLDTFYPGDALPELLTQDFAAPLRMVDPGVGFKKYPCQYFTHRPIDAALAIREEFKIEPSQIDRVQVLFAPNQHVERPKPRTGLEGKFSVQYTVAIALLDGEVTIDSFTDERRFAADVAELLPKVELTFDDSIPSDFDQTYATVKVWLRDGRLASKKVDKLSGWVGIPLTREQRLKKFYSCTRRVLDDRAADRMLERVERLETLSDVTEIMDIARCDRSKSNDLPSRFAEALSQS